MRLLHKIIPYALFVFYLVLYIHNLSRSVYGGDVGDFVTTAAIGGVAHPPGYPFFVFLGFILTHLMLFFTPAFAVGIISSFSGAVGIVVLFFILKRLTKSNLVSIITSLICGFSYLYWFYAEIAEVFAFHTLLILLLFYFAISYEQIKKVKYLFLFSFILGLSATIHQTIVLFLPSYLLIIFPIIWKQKQKRKVLPLAIALACSNLLWYIYVFVASSHHPSINWDNVHDIPSLLHLILRRDYGTLSAGLFATPSVGQRIVILKSYFFTILTQLTIPVITVGCLGLLVFFKKSWRYGLAFFVAFVLSGPVFITYAGFPLEGSFYFGIYERFFIMSTIPILICFGMGLNSLSSLFAKIFSRPIYFVVINCIFLLIPLQLFFFNMQKTDLSQVNIGDQLGIDFLAPLPKDSLILVGGDTTLFNTWYMHYARNVRPDIHLNNMNLLSFDHYIQSEEKPVKKQFPNLKENELIAKTLLAISHKHHVYAYEQIQAIGKTKLTWIPTGFVYELSPDGKVPEKSTFLQTVNTTLAKIHIPLQNDKNYKNLTIADIPKIYAKSLWSVGNYLFYTYKDYDNALVYYKKAIDVYPNYDSPYITSGLIYLTSKNDCQKAQSYLTKSIEITPFNELPYFLLYTTYTECFHNKTKANAVIAAFEKEFHLKFFDELAKNLNLIKK